ncbi:Succinate-semialdehyde dehydrogenase (NAD(P)(+)) [Alteripontixanthobacter maritimus]|uniref:Succinate-semialdehyde dehydrogenase (NAD(P)(+)) n=1 Tax=Alteripontixanthobacter maritimus TaxID=2161824 RepID=A0A369Q3F2_9SPHN|nr:NAD-dependent succinate-semialdehyde dehydrogenase [Alteripontixanthobacter maritimus]RDC59042.1 Succinate-semialdehyde dehydrogenase (NAD(P)(+)) [Alteripontixanthobacter maritimus]
MTDYPALHNLIAGEQVTGGGRETFDVLDPATGASLGHLPKATADDLDRALQAADEGFKTWRATPAAKRAGIIMKAAALLKERAADIAHSLTREQGKPLAEAKGEVMYTAMLLEFYAGECQRLYGRLLVRPEGARAEVRYEPVGPIAGFAPWNFPIINVVRKIGGGIAAGCSVIVKPSEETPASALALVQAFLDAGVPGNVVQCVFGDPDMVSRHLIDSPVIRKITFTGSTPVGKHLAKLAAEDMKRVTMELGGHAPVLVFAEADIDKALDTMAATKFRNAGQVCISPTRFLVEDSVFEEFRDGFVERAKAIKVGNGLEDGTQMGPMANPRRPDQIGGMVSDAADKGATLHTGGERIGNQGFFFAPTVLSDVPLEADIMNEEPFGPIALINRYAGEDEMIAEANRLPYGLAAYAWSNDVARRRRLADRIETGMLGINSAGLSAVDAPFGGVKWSGYGSEDGPEGVMACMVTKTVHEG